ncbi:MAG: hypothetical protein HYU64_10395 [Armatimonadetes bacterium]|nr:hypothetical protein [Armatimonadota bacterium]
MIEQVQKKQCNIDKFIQDGAGKLKKSDDPEETARVLREKTQEMMDQCTISSPGDAISLMIFKDKNISDLAEARKEELYKKNTPPEEKAQEAAEKMRELVQEDKSALSWIKKVIPETDFLGRPRLRLVAERPNCGDNITANIVGQSFAYDDAGNLVELPQYEWKCVRRTKEKFENAVEWNFSDYPDSHPMSEFGVGYKIQYDDPVFTKKDNFWVGLSFATPVLAGLRFGGPIGAAVGALGGLVLAFEFSEMILRAKSLPKHMSEAHF